MPVLHLWLLTFVLTKAVRFTPLTYSLLSDVLRTDFHSLLTSVTLQATLEDVRIRNFAHKGPRPLYAENTAKGVLPASADKLTKLLLFFYAITEPERFAPMPA